MNAEMLMHSYAGKNKKNQEKPVRGKNEVAFFLKKTQSKKR